MEMYNCSKKALGIKYIDRTSWNFTPDLENKKNKIKSFKGLLDMLLREFTLLRWRYKEIFENSI